MAILLPWFTGPIMSMSCTVVDVVKLPFQKCVDIVTLQSLQKCFHYGHHVVKDKWCWEKVLSLNDAEIRWANHKWLKLHWKEKSLHEVERTVKSWGWGGECKEKARVTYKERQKLDKQLGKWRQKNVIGATLLLQNYIGGTEDDPWKTLLWGKIVKTLGKRYKGAEAKVAATISQLEFKANWNQCSSFASNVFSILQISIHCWNFFLISWWNFLCLIPLEAARKELS